MQKQSCGFGKNKMSKKAWIQIVESSVAILIMIGFIILMTGKTQVKETNLQDKVNGLVLQIEQDDVLREKIISNEDLIVDIQSLTALNFAYKIDDNEISVTLPSGKEIYSASVVISNLDNTFKTFTLYVWK